MKLACRDVKEGTLSVRRAAETYNIPKSTLSDRVTGKVKEKSHSGPTRYLSDEEEAELVHFVDWISPNGLCQNQKGHYGYC